MTGFQVIFAQALMNLTVYLQSSILQLPERSLHLVPSHAHRPAHD